MTGFNINIKTIIRIIPTPIVKIFLNLTFEYNFLIKKISNKNATKKLMYAPLEKVNKRETDKNNTTRNLAKFLFTRNLLIQYIKGIIMKGPITFGSLKNP